MTSPQRLARIAGALYLATFITSIPALILKNPLLDDPSFIVGNGATASVMVAAWLEIALAAACVGTAVALYPVTRRLSAAAAIGFVAARITEATIIVVGVIALLAVINLRANLGVTTLGATDSLVVAQAALVAVHDWAFLIGPGLIPAFNAVLLGWVLYRTGLVARWIPAVGLVGAPLLAASATATMFGVWDQVSVWAAMSAAPIAVWELSLGVWLVLKGFTPHILREHMLDA